LSRLVKAPPGHKLAGLGGFIAPNTECPFLKKCCGPEPCFCGHKGLEHTVYFSCALARAFDIGEEIDEEWKKDEEVRLNKEFKTLVSDAPVISEEEVRKALAFLANDCVEDTEDD
jgi:hypothetical protein